MPIPPYHSLSRRRLLLLPSVVFYCRSSVFAFVMLRFVVLVVLLLESSISRGFPGFLLLVLRRCLASINGGAFGVIYCLASYGYEGKDGLERVRITCDPSRRTAVCPGDAKIHACMVLAEGQRLSGRCERLVQMNQKIVGFWGAPEGRDVRSGHTTRQC